MVAGVTSGTSTGLPGKTRTLVNYGSWLRYIMLNETMNMQDEAKRLRESGALGRSSQLLDLFDYLVSQSERERSPKEADIAMTVFGRGGDFDPAQDALVRVHVHRLRGKLDQFYATADNLGLPRLSIPKGEYRLVLEPGSPIPPPEAAANAMARGSSRKWMASTTILAVIAAVLAVLLVISRTDGHSQLADASPWRETLTSDRTALVVVGDRFVFGENGAGPGGRLVFDPSIVSKAEFDERRMLDGNFARQSFDPGSTFLPSGVAVALRHIMPAFSNADRSAIRTRLLPLSQVTPDMMRAANIIYIGHLRDLSLLEEPVFAGSAVAPAAGGTQLIARSDRSVLARLATQGTTDHDSSHDFGYISAFPGPSGNFYLVIAGGGDAGLMQAAEVAADPARLLTITQAAGQGNAFEAVLDVTSLGTMNVGSRTIMAGPLNQSAIWSGGAY